MAFTEDDKEKDELTESAVEEVLDEADEDEDDVLGSPEPEADEKGWE